MNIETLPLNEATLQDYGRIPVRFEVRAKLDIELVDSGLGGIVFREVEVVPAYVKDYDSAMAEHTRWDRRFDVTNWALFLARVENMPAGGAVVALRTPGVDMLERREDLAVLWDIRVHPEYRRSGIGTALFAEAARWAKERGCTQLKVETQNTNVPACRFYVRQGCRLGEVHRFKYVHEPESAHEVMLVWYLDLCR